MVEKPYLGPILCEEHWQASGDPERMEKFLGERGSRRRWQLFACECCWRILPLLTDDRSRAAVSLAERQAEGLAGPADVADAQDEAHAAVLEAWQPVRHPALAAAAMAASYALSRPRRAYVYAVQAAGGVPAERLAQCRLLRELFGNPFRPVAVEPAWRTPAVLAIAQHIYEREVFAELPVLADALEDAGCADGRLLGHCRGEPPDQAPHTRGCWALDAVLGKD